MFCLVEVPFVSKQELETMETKRGFAHSIDHIRTRQSCTVKTSIQIGWIQ